MSTRSTSPTDGIDPIRAAHISARIDRLPAVATVWRLVALLSIGGFFELYDLFQTAYISPGLISDGIFHLGKEGVFEIGGIEMARCQHCNGRLARTALRLHRFQRIAQQLGIVLDRAHLDLLEQFRKQLQHRFAVFQHVGHT